MAERGIIFSAPMVQALLDGRKTQTRRLINPQPSLPIDTIFRSGRKWWTGDCLTAEKDEDLKVPIAIGDRLYVREAWHVRSEFSDVIEVGYRASENRGHTEYVEQIPVGKTVPGKGKWPRFPNYGPSIHMPRWASRITLTVTGVRVQQLQEITLGDICAEGLATSIYDFKPATYGGVVWADLWNSLHTKPGTTWDDNPWIYALTFDVERRNIDTPQGGAA